jgi:hypothetical protein
MAGWVMKQKADLLPILDEQHCFFCDSKQWSWVYLLLNAPDWVQRLPWVINWFVVTCDRCHDDLADKRLEPLATRWNASEFHRHDFAEVIEVFSARLSEPPLTRAEAQSSAPA